jgi:hypothetical protein
VLKPTDENRQTRSTDLPDVLIFRILVKAPLAKVFRFYRSANHMYVRHIPCPSGGTYRDRHDMWVRDAMDAAALLAEQMLVATAKSRGPGAPTLASSLPDWRCRPYGQLAGNGG